LCWERCNLIGALRPKLNKGEIGDWFQIFWKVAVRIFGVIQSFNSTLMTLIS